MIHHYEISSRVGFVVSLTHIAHMGLQLRHALIFRSVQHHREVGEVLLGLNVIVVLERRDRSKRVQKEAEYR